MPRFSDLEAGKTRSGKELLGRVGPDTGENVLKAGPGRSNGSILAIAENGRACSKCSS